MRYIFKLFILILLSVVTHAKLKDNNMLDNSVNLLNEITRIGTSEKWNSSFFLEGPLKVHVLKNGTVTDKGSFVLSKKKFGYPAIIKVLNIDNPEKKFIFIFSPASQPVFKNSIVVNVSDLKENNYFLFQTEVVDKKSSLYSSPYSSNFLYKHIFKNFNNHNITYQFYSKSREVTETLEYIRLVVYFND